MITELLPVGTMVVVEAPGSRASDGEVQQIPAVVMKQENGFLHLYAFHFEGVPSHMLVPVVDVKIVSQPQALKFSFKE